MILTSFKLRDLLLVSLSAILGILSFPPFKLGFFSWFSIVPLLIVLKKVTLQKSFLYSYLYGLIFFYGIGWWLLTITVPGSIILAFYLSIFYGIFGIFTYFVFKYSVDLLIIPFAWVVLEYLRSILLTGFPWALLGYSQYMNIHLIQIADITGVYGISFILILVNIVIFSFLTKASKKKLNVFASLIILMIMLTYSKIKLDNFKPWGITRISVIQGNIPQEQKFDNRYSNSIIEKYKYLTLGASKDNPDLIVWPETSFPYLVETPDDLISIKQFSKEINIPILLGAVTKKGNEYFNSAIQLELNSDNIKIYNKVHLVPFGEYIPLSFLLNKLRNFIDKPIGDFSKGNILLTFPLKSSRSYGNSGKDLKRITKYYNFGVLICFEDCFSYISRKLVKNGSNLLINITNDAWFGYSAAPEQHLQASVFRAVENRVPVIRAANTGISSFISAKGEILSRVSERNEVLFIDGYETRDISVYGTRSFYSENGDIFIYFCLSILILCGIIEWIGFKFRT